MNKTIVQHHQNGIEAMNATVPFGKIVPMLLALLSAIGPFATDTYLPSFHDIANQLQTTTVGVQQSLTAYFAALAIMTLWNGALSDTYGRRAVILWGTAAFTLASIGCAMAKSIETLIVFRIMQGLSGGVGMVVVRAVVRDCYQGSDAQRVMSRIVVMFALAPTVAPVVGGYLQIVFGWRSVFYFLAVYSALLWMGCYISLPETLSTIKRQSFSPKNLMRGYAQILSHRRFWLLCVAMSCAFMGLFIYIISAPIFLMQHLGLKENQFYWLFAPATMGMMAGSWFSGFVAGHWSSTKTLKLGLFMIASASLLNVLINASAVLFSLPIIGIPWSILPFAFYAFGSSLCMPTLSIMAMDFFPNRRGMASSCQSFIQVCIMTGVAGFVVPVIWDTPLHLALGMFAMMSITMGLFVFLKKNGKLTLSYTNKLGD